MKIVFLVHQFYPDHYTGTEKFLLGLAKSCQRMGHRVKVITYSFRPNSFFDQESGDILLKEDIYQKIPVLYLKQKHPPAEFGHELKSQELTDLARQILADEKPDLLHAAHTMRLAEFVQVARQMEIPYVLTLTDFFLICPKANLMTSVNSLCAGPENGKACRELCSEIPARTIDARLAEADSLLTGARCVVAPSKFLAAMYLKEYPQLNIKHIGYGVSYANIRKNNKTYKADDELTFFYGGSITRHKGVQVLIEAFKKMKGYAKLKIYGSGTYEAVIKNLAKYDPRVEFCGVFSSEQMGEILNQVDVIIVPSIWYENTPIMLLEALASDVPAVVTDLGGMTEVVKDNINGRAFRISDPDHLAQALSSMVDDPEILNTYKDNIKGQFIPSVEQEGLAYQREYQAICQAKAGE